jgi:hypothetical protein
MQPASDTSGTYIFVKEQAQGRKGRVVINLANRQLYLSILMEMKLQNKCVVYSGASKYRSIRL